MRKLEIARAVATNCKIPLKDAERAVNATFEAVVKGLLDDGKVSVRGLGSWVIRRRRARMARVPKTGELVPLPERDVPFFKASKLLCKTINKSK